MNDPTTSRVEALHAALQYLRSAIDLLDQAGAPGQIAAHADLAAQQLGELLGRMGKISADRAGVP